MPLRVDPEFKALIPALSTDERDGLEADIVRDRRAIVPLIAWGEILLDGHNRFEICSKHGLPFEVKSAPNWIMDRRDARIWIRSTALNRRNLGPITRAQLVSGNETDLREKNRERQQASRAKPGEKVGSGKVVKNSAPPSDKEASKTRTQAAKQAGMSHPTYAAAKEVAEKGTPELRAAADTGILAVSTAAQLVTLPAEKQREVIAKGPSAAKEAAKVVRQENLEKKRQERVQKIADISAGNTPITKDIGRFPVLYADPPWRYEHVETESRAVENQYPTMRLDEICALPVAKLATDDAWLFLWATSPKLAEAMKVIEAWGFQYRTCAVWVKPTIGMGYVYRQRHELLLVAKRGRPPVPGTDARPPSVIEAPSGLHSEKPGIARKQIETMFPAWKRIELFARGSVPGWAVWGNQARK